MENDQNKQTVVGLKFGQQIDLIAISTTEQKLVTGEQSQTDSLGPTIKFSGFKVKVQGYEIQLNTSAIPSNCFVQTKDSSDSRLLYLDFNSHYFLDKNNLFERDDQNIPFPDVLKIIRANDLKVILSIKFSGAARTDTGMIVVYPNQFSVEKIMDCNENPIHDSEIPLIKDLIGDLNDAKFVAYDVMFHRINPSKILNAPNINSLGVVANSPENFTKAIVEVVRSFSKHQQAEFLGVMKYEFDQKQ